MEKGRKREGEEKEKEKLRKIKRKIKTQEIPIENLSEAKWLSNACAKECLEKQEETDWGKEKNCQNKEWFRVTWRVESGQENWEGVLERIGRTRRDSWRNLRMEYGSLRTAAMKQVPQQYKLKATATQGQWWPADSLEDTDVGKIATTERQDSTGNWQLNALQRHGIVNGTGIPHWSRILERGLNKADEQLLNNGCGSRTSSKALQAEDLEGKFLLDVGKVGRAWQPICQGYTKLTSLTIPGNFWFNEDKRRAGAILWDAAATWPVVIFVAVAPKQRSPKLSVSWWTIYGLVDRLPVSAGNFGRALQRHFVGASLKRAPQLRVDLASCHDIYIYIYIGIDRPTAVLDPAPGVKVSLL